MLKTDVLLHYDDPVIIVVDEADKAFVPKQTSVNDSYGQMLSYEFLKIMDGGFIYPVTVNKATYQVAH